MHLIRKCEVRLVFPLLPLFINPTCAVVIHLVTSCGSPAAGRGATSGEAEALCSCMDFVLVDALPILSTCLNPEMMKQHLKEGANGRTGMQSRQASTLCWVHAGSCSCRQWLHKITKSVELLQGRTYFFLLKAKKPCPAFCIILGQPQQAGWKAGGGKTPSLVLTSVSPSLLLFWFVVAVSNEKG